MTTSAFDNMMRMATAAIQISRQHRESIPVVQAPQIFGPPTAFDQMMQMANSDEAQYSQYAEIHRICSLPIAQRLSPAQLEEFNRTHLLADAYLSGFRLHPIQCEAVRQYEEHQGAFLKIGVGWGKTLTALMIANIAWSRGIRKMTHFCPASVYEQLIERDIKWARMRVPITYPMIEMGGGRGMDTRRKIAESGKNGLYIIPYSLASTQDGENNIASISPELMIFDECHQLRNRSAARTKRVLRVMHDSKPHSVDLSGTITSKSIADYHHLISQALGPKSPLPLSTHMMNEWAAVLDADAPEEGGATGPLLPLIKWAKQHFPQEQINENIAGFRRAYRLRLDSCPGVAASGDADIGVSLHIHNERIANPEWYENWGILDNLIKQVTEQYITPNGDEIEHAMLTWKWLYELTCGFYNQLTWPTIETVAQRLNISFEASTELMGRSYLYYQADQNYAKKLRGWLDRYHVPGMDSPFLVGKELAANGPSRVGSELHEAWFAKKSLDFAGRIERDKTAIRVCDYKVQAAVRWAHSIGDQGGIIWVYHAEVGRWIYEYLQHYGIPCLHCPAGPQGNTTIGDVANANKIVVASITAHGEGKNLQHFQHQYIVQFPRVASKAEQVLGRVHRVGQKADEIIVTTNHSIEWDDMNFAACLNDSLYIHQTQTRQKLIYCTYDPLPKIYPPLVMQERGLQLQHQLTQRQQAEMQERFGSQ